MCAALDLTSLVVVNPGWTGQDRTEVTPWLGAGPSGYPVTFRYWGLSMGPLPAAGLGGPLFGLCVYLSTTLRTQKLAPSLLSVNSEVLLASLARICDFQGFLCS